MAAVLLTAISSFSLFHGHSQTLPLPPRAPDALSGSEFVQAVTSLPRQEREDWIIAQVLQGNIPQFMRTLVPVTTSMTIGGTNRTVTYHVAPDYLAIGSDSDYFLCPTTPLLAQRLCDALDCTLPTRKMVDQIWTSATVKLSPAPIAPSPEMITVPVFDQHNSMVWTQRMAVTGSRPLGQLVGGTKKDVVISRRIYENFANPGITKPVVIYGWHYLSGSPIQPLYNGHAETYADYSHGIRLVQMAVTLNGQPDSVTNLCADPVLHPLLSDEGVITRNRYTITPMSPRILVHPENRAVTADAEAVFTVLAAGDAPLAYQWQRNGTDLPGANQPSLCLSKVQPSDAGQYRVRITNDWGSLTSTAASLTIITSPPALNHIQREAPNRTALGLTNAPTPRYAAQASEDLSQWNSVAVLPGEDRSPPFIDPGSISDQPRFYRALQTTGVELIDFESVAPGGPALFRNPSYSGSTATFLDTSGANPDFTAVTGTPPTGLQGSRALHVAWTFAAAATNPWLRLTTHQAVVLPNPTVRFDAGLCFDAYVNRDVFIALGLRETGTSASEGSDGGTSGAIEWVGGTSNNSVSPPVGRFLKAGQWTRVCFVTPDEPVRAFTGDGLLGSPTGRGVLEHLALVPGDGGGEYHLYLDNFQSFDPDP